MDKILDVVFEAVVTVKGTERSVLTAETVIGVLEDPAEDRRFAAEICREFKCKSGMEEVLAARLASLLWRLRRATAIESGLLQLHGMVLRDNSVEANFAKPSGLGTIYQLLRNPDSPASTPRLPPFSQEPGEGSLNPIDIARCFQRVARLDAEVFDRVVRYEMMLWRQILCLLRAFPVSNDRPKKYRRTSSPKF